MKRKRRGGGELEKRGEEEGKRREGGVPPEQQDDGAVLTVKTTDCRFPLKAGSSVLLRTTVWVKQAFDSQQQPQSETLH